MAWQVEWKSLNIYAADIGSVNAGNFGWAKKGTRLDLDTNSSIQALAEAVAEDLQSEHPVALGFEAPVFAPVPSDLRKLGKRRSVDPPTRPWSAGAGATVMSTGLVQLAWVIRWLVKNSPGPWTGNVGVNWSEFLDADVPGLFLWEAMVTGDVKSDKSSQFHNIEDAKLVVNKFDSLGIDGVRKLAEEQAQDDPHISLVGAVLVANSLGFRPPHELLLENPVVVTVQSE